MPKLKHLFFTVFVFFFALGCKKEKAVVESEITATELAPLNDTLEGRVYLTKNTSLVPNATVSIAGSTLQTISDQNGFYRFINLGAGTYDIDVVTPKKRRNQVQQLSTAASGKTVLDLKTYDDDFYSHPKTTASIRSSTSSAKSLFIEFEYAFDGGGPYVMAVLSDSTGADPALVKSFDYSFDQYLGPYKGLYIDLGDKKYYPSGTKVYVDVYLHYYKSSTYTDVYSNRLVYVGGGLSRTPNAFIIWP